TARAICRDPERRLRGELSRRACVCQTRRIRDHHLKPSTASIRRDHACRPWPRTCPPVRALPYPPLELHHLSAANREVAPESELSLAGEERERTSTNQVEPVLGSVTPIVLPMSRQWIRGRRHACQLSRADYAPELQLFARRHELSPRPAEAFVWRDRERAHLVEHAIGHIECVLVLGLGARSRCVDQEPTAVAGVPFPILDVLA